jgi:hypothetical protein
LVWAFSELMVEPMAGQGFYDLAREQAEALEARKAQAEEYLASTAPMRLDAPTHTADPHASSDFRHVGRVSYRCQKGLSASRNASSCETPMSLRR